MIVGLNPCVSRQLLSRGAGDTSSSQEDQSDYEGRFADGRSWSPSYEEEGDLKVTGREAAEVAPPTVLRRRWEVRPLCPFTPAISSSVV